MKIPDQILNKFNLPKRKRTKRRQFMVVCCVCHKRFPEKDTELKLFKRLGKNGAAYRPCCKLCLKKGAK